MFPKLSLLLTIALIAGCTATAAGEPDQSPPIEAADQGAPASTEARDHDEEVEGYPPRLYKRAPYDREYDVSELYDAMCATCHGEDGDGDTPIDDAFSFDTPADQWTNGPTIDGILLTLEDGIHDTAMSDFPQYSNIDREQLAAYVLELRQALKADGE